MRKIFKFLSYSLLYLVVSVASAYGVITFSMNNNSGNSNLGSGGGGEIVIADEINAIVNNLTSANALDIVLQADIESGESDITVGLDGQIDLSGGIDNLMAEVNLNLGLGENQFDIAVAYQNNVVYFELLGGKFMLATDNFMDSIEQITSLVGVELPDIGSMLGGLDLNGILTMLSNFTESDNADGSKLLQVAIPIVENLSINMTCTEDYQLTKFELPSFAISGMNIGAEADIDYLENSNIAEVDASEFIDLTDVVDVAVSVVDYAASTNGEIGLGYQVEYDGIDVNGQMFVDINDRSGKVAVNHGDYSANVLLIDGQLYLEIFNIYLKFDITQVDSVCDLVETYFDITLPREIISSIADALVSGDFSGVTGNIEMPEFDLSTIDLSVIEKFEFVDGKATVTIRDIGTIEILTNDGAFSGISVNISNVNANLNVIEYSDFALASEEGNYVEISDLIPTIENVFNIMQNNTFSGNAVVNIGDFSVDVEYLIHMGEETFAVLSTTLYGQQIEVTILGGYAYLEVSDSKIKVDLNDIETLLDTIKNSSLGQYISGALDSMGEMSDSLGDLISKDINPLLITKFVKTEDGLEMSILNKLNLTITNGENSLGLIANYDNIQADITISGSEKDIATPVIASEEYTLVDDLVETVINVYDYVMAKEFYLEIGASYDGFEVEGYVNFAESLEFSLSLTYQNLTASIMFYQGNIYVECENIKLVFDLDDIESVKNFLNEYFGLDIDTLLSEMIGSDIVISSDFGSMLDSIDFESLLPSTGDINLEEILSKLTFSLASDKIVVNYDGLNVTALLDGNMLDSISLAYTLDGKPITADVTVLDKASIFYPAGEYVNVKDILDIASSVIDYVQGGKIGLGYQVEYDGIYVNGQMFVDINDRSGKVAVNYGDYSANVLLIDGQLYLEIFNIYLKFDITQVDSVCDLVETYFDITLPREIISSIADALVSGDFSGVTGNIEMPEFDLSTIDLSVIEKFEFVDGKATVTIRDIGTIEILTNDGAFSGISVNISNVNANLNVIEYSDFALASEEGNYVEISDLIPTIENVFNIMQNNTFSGNAVVNIGDFSVDVEYLIHMGEETFAVLSTTLYGQQIEVTILGGYAYLEVSDSKIKVDLNDIETLLDTIKNSSLGQYISGALDSMGEMSDSLGDLISKDINPLLITKFVKTEDGLEMSILNKLNLTITNGENSLGLIANYDNIQADITISGSEKDIATPVIASEEYTLVDDLVETVINVYDYVMAKEFYLEIGASYDGFEVEGYVNFAESLEFSLSLTYQNLTASIMFYQGNIYVECENIKLVFDLDDIESVKNFLNEYFGLDIDTLLSEMIGSDIVISSDFGSMLDSIDFESLLPSTGDINLEEILSKLTFSLASDKIVVNYDGLNVTALLDGNMLDSISLAYTLDGKPITADVTVLDKASIFYPAGEYVNVKEVMSYAEMLIDYISSKQFELGLNVNFAGMSIVGDAQVDLTDQIMLSASVVADGMDINVNIEDGMLYFDYNGLLLKMDNSGFNELLFIVLEVIGIDANSIPFLSEIDLNLDFSMIDTDVASMDITFEDIVNIISMVKEIKVQNSSLVIRLDGQKVYNNPNAEDIVITLASENGKIKNLTLANCYLDSNLTNAINGEITFGSLGEFKHVDSSKNYIDISGANELVKAIVNMSHGKQFHVSGSFNVNATIDILFEIPINVDVPIDIYINVVGKGDIELYAVIGEIPCIPFVNASGLSTSNRMLYIYYKSGYIYFHRTEKSGSDTIDYKTKVSLETVLADPFHYVQYCFGLSDSIMDVIIESMDNPRTEPMDMGNIITSFLVNDDKMNYTVNLNMHELTNNPDLGNMAISLGLMQDSDGNNYIGKYGFSLELPLADVFYMNLSTDNLQMVDYNSEQTAQDVADKMKNLNDFINSYSFPEETEWQGTNGSYTENKIYRTVTFVTNSNVTIAEQSYQYKDTLALPTISENKIVDDTTAMIRYYYSFAGWYEDSECTRPFEDTTMPSKNITLYAKWELFKSEKIVKISFVTNGNETYDTIYVTENSSVDLSGYVPTKQLTYIDNGYKWDKAKVEFEVTRYTFAGWYTDETLGNAFAGYVGSSDLTLYAKFNATVTTEYYILGQKPK